MRSVLLDTPWGALATALAVSSLMLLATVAVPARPRGAWIRSRLEPYGGPASARTRARAGVFSGSLPRLQGLAEQALRRTSLASRLERTLERAHVRRTPATMVFWSVALGVAATLVVGLGSSSFGLGLLALVAGLAAPWLWTAQKARRRMLAFDAQLPDALLTISGALRVGHSFSQSMRTIVEEGQAPASEEFERVLAETRLGRPLDEALEAMATRIDSDDLRFALMSVTIQREVGGSLAELLQTVSDTVRDRQQFRRKVRALTATGRASAYVLLALPLVTAAGIALVNPGYMEPLYRTGLGQVLVAATAGMVAVGAIMLKKIVDVKG